MAYQVVVDGRALKGLARLPKKIQRQVMARIEALADDPCPSGAKRIEGQEDLWRIRSGDYQISYVIKRKTVCVVVIRVGDRKDFYKYFARRKIR